MPRAISRSSCREAAISVRARPTRDAGRLVGAELRLEQPQLERERDQPLLGAVVQVALEALALAVAGLDDPGPRAAQLLQPGAQLHLQARVLERDAGGGRDAVEQLGLVEQRRVVHERGHGLAVALDHRHARRGARLRAAPPRGRRGRRRSRTPAASTPARGDGSRSARASASRSSTGLGSAGRSMTRSPTDARASRASSSPKPKATGARPRMNSVTRCSRRTPTCRTRRSRTGPRASPAPRAKESTRRASQSAHRPRRRRPAGVRTGRRRRAQGADREQLHRLDAGAASGSSDDLQQVVRRRTRRASA